VFTGQGNIEKTMIEQLNDSCLAPAMNSSIRDRITKNLKKRAADMGFELVPKDETKEAWRLASAVG